MSLPHSIRSQIQEFLFGERPKKIDHQHAWYGGLSIAGSERNYPSCRIHLIGMTRYAFDHLEHITVHIGGQSGEPRLKWTKEMLLSICQVHYESTYRVDIVFQSIEGYPLTEYVDIGQFAIDVRFYLTEYAMYEDYSTMWGTFYWKGEQYDFRTMDEMEDMEWKRRRLRKN